MRASTKKHGKIDESAYDLVIDTDSNEVKKVYEIVKDYLSLDSVRI